MALSVSYRPDQDVNKLRIDGGGSSEMSIITPTTLDGNYEVQKVIHPAVSAMAQGDFYVLQNIDGTKFAVWFDIDANGTEPNGPIYTACDVKIKASVATGDLAPAVATAANTAIGLEAGFVKLTKVKTSDYITFTSTIRGNVAAPASYVEAETSGPFTVSTLTGGSNPAVCGKYFTLKNTTTGFYYWFTSNGVGSDPAVAAHTSKVIALTGNESQAQFLTAIEAVIEATSGLTSQVDGSRIYVTVDTGGPVTDISAGDSGFTVEAKVQGYSQQYMKPYDLPSALVNEPSSLS